MATREITFLQNELAIRKQRLETAIAMAPDNSGLAGLLREHLGRRDDSRGHEVSACRPEAA